MIYYQICRELGRSRSRKNGNRLEQATNSQQGNCVLRRLINSRWIRNLLTIGGNGNRMCHTIAEVRTGTSRTSMPSPRSVRGRRSLRRCLVIIQHQKGKRGNPVRTIKCYRVPEQIWVPQDRRFPRNSNRKIREVFGKFPRCNVHSS